MLPTGPLKPQVVRIRAGLAGGGQIGRVAARPRSLTGELAGVTPAAAGDCQAVSELHPVAHGEGVRGLAEAEAAAVPQDEHAAVPAHIGDPQPLRVEAEAQVFPAYVACGR